MITYDRILCDMHGQIQNLATKQTEALPRIDEWISDYNMGTFVVISVNHITTGFNIDKIEVMAYSISHPRFNKKV